MARPIDILTDTYSETSFKIKGLRYGNNLNVGLLDSDHHYGDLHNRNKELDMGIHSSHSFPANVRNERIFQQAFNPIRNFRGKIRGTCYDPVFPDMVAKDGDHVLDREFDHLADMLGVDIQGLHNLAYLNSWTNWAFGQIAKSLKTNADRRMFYEWKCSLIFVNGDREKGVKKPKHNRGEKSDALRAHTRTTQHHRVARKIRETTEDSERKSIALGQEIDLNVKRQTVVKAAGKSRKKGKADLDAMFARFARYAAKQAA